MRSALFHDRSLRWSMPPSSHTVLLRRVCEFALLALLTAGMAAQSLPRTESETLSGKKVVLPDDARGKVTLFIVGFSRKSKDPTTAWARVISREFAGDGDFSYYQVAVLEDVPRLLRGFVVRGIRGGVPQEQHDRFLLLFQGELQWKTLCHYAEPNQAYLVLTDAAGSVRWQADQPFSDATWTELRAQVHRLESVKS